MERSIGEHLVENEDRTQPQEKAFFEDEETPNSSEKNVVVVSDIAFDNSTKPQIIMPDSLHISNKETLDKEKDRTSGLAAVSAATVVAGGEVTVAVTDNIPVLSEIHPVPSHQSCFSQSPVPTTLPTTIRKLSLQNTLSSIPFSIHSSVTPVVITKRGPGRPRKDSNFPCVTVTKRKIAEPKKILRGRGRPRKDGSSPVQHKKIFPGRPRMGKTKKTAHRALIIPPGPTHVISSAGSVSAMVLSESKEGKTFLSPQNLSPLQHDIHNIHHSVDYDEEFNPSTATVFKKTIHEELVLQHQWPGKVCAFCNLGEHTLLGQGELVRFDPSPGFNAFKRCVKLHRSPSESESDLPHEQRVHHPKFVPLRRQKGFSKFGRERSKLHRRSAMYNAMRDMSRNQPGPLDELTVVGFHDEPDVNSVFESTGHTFAHHCCAAWSEGVCLTKEYGLTNVDKAVIMGMSQRCASCRRFGATIRCRSSKCNNIYHYPCAASSGTFQDVKSLSLLCTLHLDQAPCLAGTEANCVVCCNSGNIAKLLYCTSCGHHYHGSCLDPPVSVSAAVRAGWQCADCKICQTCRRQPGDDNKMLVCDTCDKGYHTFCLKPMMTTIPKSGWKCKNCRVCGDCGARTPGSGPSSRWHMNYTVCDSCYQQRNKGVACPLCGKAYRQFSQKGEMEHCAICRKFIHVDCDPRIVHQTDSTPYICPVCSSPNQNTISKFGQSDVIKVKGKDDMIVTDCGPSLSRDSFGSLNEDSVSSMDTFEKDGSVDKNPLLLCPSLPVSVPPLPPQITDSILQDPPYMCYTPHRPLPFVGKFPGKKRMGVGRSRGGGKFAGKRRAKTAEFRRKRGPKPKVKSFNIPGAFMYPGTTISDSKDSKQDDEPAADNKMVLCSATDEFVLSQDLCVMCGSFGKGEEGRVIACSQCGQCYHPYCVSIKVTTVVLNKGWRCLDCTVCEGCGQPHDEGRLLLCDDCDISYHTYCLDPPLDDVPEGNWKCKWCVVCLQCGARTPGYKCQWQNNYTQCGPCASQILCPVCHQNYQENDLIIQCIQCDRWLHGKCDQMTCEEDAELCADFGYHCSLCRPKDECPPHLLPKSGSPTSVTTTGPSQCAPSGFETLPSPPTPPSPLALPPPPPPPPEPPQPVSPVQKSSKETESSSKPKPQAQFYMDGVFLSESGMRQIKSLTLEQPKKTRTRRPKQSSAVPSCPSVLSKFPNAGEKIDEGDEHKSVSITESSIEGGNDSETRMEVDEEIKLGNDEGPKPDGTEAVCEKKKRQRKLHKLGIGGFIAKPRGRSLSVAKEQSSDQASNVIEVGSEGQLTGEPAVTLPGDIIDLGQEKPKRRRRLKKKNPLEDNYPTYLQEAFFGKSLLVTSKEMEPSFDIPSEEEALSPTTSQLFQDKTVVLVPPPSLQKAENNPVHSTAATATTTVATVAVLVTTTASTPAATLTTVVAATQTVTSTVPPSTLTSLSTKGKATSSVQMISSAEIKPDVLVRASSSTSVITSSSQHSSLISESTSQMPISHPPKKEIKKCVEVEEEKNLNSAKGVDEEDLKDILPQDLPQDDELMDMLMSDNGELSKHEELDAITSVDATLEGDQNRPEENETSTNKEDPLTANIDSVLLSPHFNLDSMVGDTGLPQMDSKDVEDIFKGVFSPHEHTDNSATSSVGQAAPSTPSQIHGTSPQPSQRPPPASSAGPTVQLSSQQTPPTPGSGHSLGSPFGMATSPFTSEYGSSSQFSPQLSEPRSPWLEQESEAPGHGQKNILKWESDEPLGHNATISPVLYANMNHPNLKSEFPSWVDRSKQIAKIWRSLPSEKRQPYLQKARENRATSRIQKAQVESSKLGRDQKSHREVDQERQWKQLQAIRQQQHQKQQQILQEQRAQAVAKAQQAVLDKPDDSSSETSNQGATLNVSSPIPSVVTSPLASTTPPTPTLMIPASVNEACAPVQCPPSSTPNTVNSQISHCTVNSISAQLPSSPQMPGQLNIAQQAQILQQRSPSQGRIPTPVSPLIQVSRVRPPIDPSRLPNNDPYISSPSSVAGASDIFLPPQRPVFAVRPVVQQRPPYPPTSQVSQPPLPNSRSEGSRPPTPTVNQEIFQTPPPTPRPQNTDTFRQQSPTRTQLHSSQDPYAQPSPTAIPVASPFSPSQAPSSVTSSPLDPYSQPPPTPRSNLPVPESFTSPSSTPTSRFSSETPFSQHVACQAPPPSPGSDSYPQSSPTHHQVSNLPPGDPYAKPPGTPLPVQSTPSRLMPRHISEPSQNDLQTLEAEGQLMARQQLRDLLQRQQLKKQQEHTIVREQQQGQIPLRHWPADPVRPDIPPSGNVTPVTPTAYTPGGIPSSTSLQSSPQQTQEVLRPAAHETIRRPGTPNIVPRSPSVEDGFRHPFPAGIRPRISPTGGSGGVPEQPFRHPAQLLDQRLVSVRSSLDARLKMLMLQQQQIQLRNTQWQMQQIRVQGPRMSTGFGNNSVENYDQLLQQRMQQLQRTQQVPLAIAEAVGRFGQPQVCSPVTQTSGILSSRCIVSSLNRPTATTSPSGLAITSSSQPFISVASSLSSGEENTSKLKSSASPPAPTVPSVTSPVPQRQQQALLQLPNQAIQSNQKSSQPSQDHKEVSTSSLQPSSNQPLSQPTLKSDSKTAVHGLIVQESASGSSSSNVEQRNGNDLNDKLPKRKTTAGDLVKEVEVQAVDHDATVGIELEEEDLDDDELLGLGNDFNILEYADPELDKGFAGEGEKSNILDEHLDLDDKDDELDEAEVEDMKTRPINEDKVLSVNIKQELPSVEEKKTIKSEVKSEIESPKCSVGSADFQTKFLEFSQQKKPDKLERCNTETGTTTPPIKDVKVKPSHIQSITCPTTTNSEIQHSLSNTFTNVTTTVATVHSPLSSNQSSSPLHAQQSTTRASVIPQQIPPAFTQPSLHLAPRKPSTVPVQPPFPDSLKMSQPPPYPSGAPPPPPPPPPPPYQAASSVRSPASLAHPVLRHQQLLTAQRSVFSNQNNIPVRPAVPSPQSVILSTPSEQQVRPLLLQEQPLLLEDLVEQEKREQRRQNQEGLISPQGDALLSDIDFERLKADVFSGPPDDAIEGPEPLLPSQNSSQPSSLLSSQVASPPSVISQRYPPPPPPPPPHTALSLTQHQQVGWQNQEGALLSPSLPRPPGPIHSNPVRPSVPPTALSAVGVHPVTMLHGEPQVRAVPTHKSLPTGVTVSGLPNNRPPFPMTTLPPPPTPPSDPSTEQERQQQAQYEQWLIQQKAVLSSQQSYLETEVGKLRKAKKALNAKQRQLRKNGNELSEHDAAELARISHEQSGLQKQLDQVRKQTRQHAMLLQEYRMKQQKRQQQLTSAQPQVHATMTSMQPSPLGSSHSPHRASSGTPQSPLMSPSPLGPSPSPRMQHSPSPLMQHSPAAMSPSLIQQQSPLAQSQLLSQQLSPHVTASQSDNGPGSRPHEVLVSQDDNNPFSESFQQREQMEKMHQFTTTSQSAPPREAQQHILERDVNSRDAVEKRSNLKQTPFYNEDKVQFPPNQIPPRFSLVSVSNQNVQGPFGRTIEPGMLHRMVSPGPGSHLRGRLGMPNDLVGQPFPAIQPSASTGHVPLQSNHSLTSPPVRPPPPYPHHLRPSVSHILSGSHQPVQKPQEGSPCPTTPVTQAHSVYSVLPSHLHSSESVKDVIDVKEEIASPSQQASVVGSAEIHSTSADGPVTSLSGSASPLMHHNTSANVEHSLNDMKTSPEELPSKGEDPQSQDNSEVSFGLSPQHSDSNIPQSSSSFHLKENVNSVNQPQPSLKSTDFKNVHPDSSTKSESSFSCHQTDSCSPKSFNAMYRQEYGDQISPHNDENSQSNNSIESVSSSSRITEKPHTRLSNEESNHVSPPSASRSLSPLICGDSSHSVHHQNEEENENSNLHQLEELQEHSSEHLSQGEPPLSTTEITLANSNHSGTSLNQTQMLPSSSITNINNSKISGSPYNSENSESTVSSSISEVQHLQNKESVKDTKEFTKQVVKSECWESPTQYLGSGDDISKSDSSCVSEIKSSIEESSFEMQQHLKEDKDKLSLVKVKQEDSFNSSYESQEDKSKIHSQGETEISIKDEPSRLSQLCKEESEMSPKTASATTTTISRCSSPSETVAARDAITQSLSQTLPSSVTNTLNFTLRQTGMPTVCLPQDEANIVSLPRTTAQVHYFGLPQTTNSELNAPSKTVVSDATLSVIHSTNGSSPISVNYNQQPCRVQVISTTSVILSSPSVIVCSAGSLSTVSTTGSLQSSSVDSKSVSSLKQPAIGTSNEMLAASFTTPVTATSTTSSPLTSTLCSNNIIKGEPKDAEVKPSFSHSVEVKQEIIDRPSCLLFSKQEMKLSSHVNEVFLDGDIIKVKGQTSENNKPVYDISTKKEINEGLCPENKVESKITEVTEKSNIKIEQILLEKREEIQETSVKIEEQLPSGEQHKSDNKSSVQLECSEGGKQNVLLKQLLQNCPSAETQRKAEDFSELIVGDGNKSSVTSSSPSLEDKEKCDEVKAKKPSYLDIRRAQLEKEPTPPPEELKPKRKRPKKKKQEGKDGSPTKKRPRKGSTSKAEEDYESFMEAMKAQLRTMPPVRILEPIIKPNFNVCPIFGDGDLNNRESQLRGSYGNSILPNQGDYYSTYPFGSNPPTPPASLPPTPPPYRGFYNQEFAVRPREHRGRVGIPASLPTPPPYVDMVRTVRDADSPDTVISSSSPECALIEPPIKWPELHFIDNDDSSGDERRRYSPIIPLIAPIPIKAIPIIRSEILRTRIPDIDDEKDKENVIGGERKADILAFKAKMAGLGGPPTPLKDTGNVSVTLTLSSAAAEDIRGVLSALADILKIPAPTKYEIVERTATPPSQKLGLYKKAKDSDVNIHSLLNGKPRFCRHCDIVVLSAGIRKKVSDLLYISREELDEDEVIFCSTNCYMQFALTHRTTSTEEKEAATVVNHLSETSAANNGVELNMKEAEALDEQETDRSSEKMDDTTQDEEEEDNANDIELGRDKKSLASPILSMSPCETIMPDTSAFEEASTQSDLCDEKKLNFTETVLKKETEKTEKDRFPGHKQSVKHSAPEDIEHTEPAPKKWKGLKWRFWTFSFISCCTYKPASEDEIAKMLDGLHICIKPEKMPPDGRKCVLCHDAGDGETNGSARLLNLDVDKWVHLNCALWSAEVYETVNGALINVDVACKRALALGCCRCHKVGASLKCFKIRCSNVYHFPCAMRDRCVFFKDKTMLCPQHTLKITNPENELESVAVFRRVYVNRDEHKQIASMIHQGDQHLIRIGSLIFLNIGQLLPHQIQAFHTPNSIYPVGYKVLRMYWSTRRLGTRCQYICSINEVEGKPQFCVQVREAGFEDLTLKDITPKGVWQQVLRPIEHMRREAQTINVFPNFISGEDLFGLTEPAVLRILESLPGVDTLSDYNFKYGRSPLLELPLAINPTGCARAEPKLRTHFKRPHTLHTSNTSRSSLQSSLGGVEVSSPYIKQFVHSKSSQYRKMKTEWRNNVYLARSHIQGLGLYAARDIEKHTMVIEYIGQLIRNEIAERNEAIYEAQNRGVYMFRLDENRVIDATLCGGLARYMNHSCNPNCVAEVVQIDRENKILIIANRRISRNEELTYDYKFEVEDDQHKIPCLCGAPNCRKWMN